MKTSLLRPTFVTSLILLSSLVHREPVWAAACPAINFVATGTFGAGINPVSVAVGDFNGDGKPDLVLANGGTANVSVLLGNGDGTFQSATSFGGLSGPSSVAVGDFNGDGKGDLAVANSGTTNASVLLGNGNGTFQAATGYGVGETSQSVAVSDVNGDGKLDLVVVNRVTANVSVLLGNGNGTFQPATHYDVGADPLAVAVGDFNGDSKPDLAVANSALFGEAPPSVSVLLGNGNGTFQPAVNYGAGSSPRSVAVGDFNGDGKRDLAVANYGSFANGQLTGSSVSILLGNGNGTFQTAVNYTAGQGPISVAAGDFNGDAKSDLAVANDRSANVSVLLGKGDGSFETPRNLAAGVNPSSVAIADLNNDGQPDLAVASFSGVSILLTTCSGSGNNPPTISSIANQTVNEDTSTSAIAFTIGDAETNPSLLTVSGASSNTGLVPNTSYVFGGSGANRTVTITPASNRTGTTTNTITVSDGSVPTSTTFILTVNPVNDPPSFVKGPSQNVVADGGAQTVTGWATAISAGPPDEASQALTFLVSNNNNALFSAQPAVAPNGTLTYTPTPTASGTATVTVRLQDNGGTANGGVNMSAEQTFTITVAQAGADVVLMQTASPSPVSLGANVTYVTVVSNRGPSSITGVVVTDTLPSGATLVTQSSSQGTCTSGGGSLTCNVGNLAAGATATLTVVVTPTAAGSITNVAVVTANEADPDVSNNRAASITQVTQVTQTITLSVARSGNDLIISGSGPLDGFDLQTKDSLTSPLDWTTLPNTPVGNAFTVPIEPSTRTKFYRVKQR